MVTAYILATTKTGKEKDVLGNLVGVSEIKEAYNVYGDYDLFIKTETKDIDALNDIIVRKIRTQPHISSTTTMITL